LHFTAKWADRVCAPHRIEVAAAVARLGWAVREVDVDTEAKTARVHGVLNVPAVAVEGDADVEPLVGAHAADALVLHLRPLG